MPKYSVMIARFPYGGVESYRCTDWLVNTVVRMKSDPRIDAILERSYNDTPITMTRNRACKDALDNKVDYLLMLDSDMHPDYEYSKPFWETSFDFCLRKNKPMMIAAPYCGPPPVENIYVFRWRNHESDHNDPDYSLAQYTREEAAERAGIEEVAALPTGIFLLDTRVLKKMPPPWFKYNYTDEYETHKDTTEDVYFTRNCSLAGFPVYCNWDSWGGHIKPKTVGKPKILTSDVFCEQVRDAILLGKNSNEKMIDVDISTG